MLLSKVQYKHRRLIKSLIESESVTTSSVIVWCGCTNETKTAHYQVCWKSNWLQASILAEIFSSNQDQDTKTIEYLSHP